MLLSARTRLIFSLLALLTVAPVSSAVQKPIAIDRPPYWPTDDDEVLQWVPPGSDPQVAKMHQLRAQLDAKPEIATAIALANAYLAFGREVGDAHFAGYAEAVVSSFLAEPSPSVDALLVKSSALLYRHQFDDARALLTRILQIDPRNAQAALDLANLDLLQGDYAAATRGCARASNLTAVELGLACLAAVRAANGHA